MKCCARGSLPRVASSRNERTRSIRDAKRCSVRPSPSSSRPSDCGPTTTACRSTSSASARTCWSAQRVSRAQGRDQDHRRARAPSFRVDEGGGFDTSPLPLDAHDGFLTGAELERDFANLYRYYREARLVQLVKRENPAASGVPSRCDVEGHQGPCAGGSSPTARSSTSTIAAIRDHAGLFRRRTTSNGSRSRATIKSPANTRTTTYSTRCSSSACTATSRSRSRTTPRPARAFTPNRWPMRINRSTTRGSSTRRSASLAA